MSIQKILRVTCDHCGCSVIVNQSCTLEADRLLSKRNWIFHRLDDYGNDAQYCNEACRDFGLEAIRKALET